MPEKKDDRYLEVNCEPFLDSAGLDMVILTSIRRCLTHGRKFLLGQKYLVFSGRSVNCQTDGS